MSKINKTCGRKRKWTWREAIKVTGNDITHTHTHTNNVGFFFLIAFSFLLFLFHFSQRKPKKILLSSINFCLFCLAVGWFHVKQRDRIPPPQQQQAEMRGFGSNGRALEVDESSSTFSADTFSRARWRVAPFGRWLVPFHFRFRSTDDPTVYGAHPHRRPWAFDF